MLEEMKRLLKEKDLCVLATVSGGRPHCSLMVYVTDEDCREVYLVTLKQTTKYKNLMENSSVSLLIDTREEHSGHRRHEAKALTVAGLFHRIEDKEEKALVRERLLNRHPHMKEFMAHPDAEPFSVKITSLLLLHGLTEAHFEMV